VVDWLRNNSNASLIDFLKFLRQEYSVEEIAKRFPDAVKILDEVIKAAERADGQ
jgi:hypothetical protein